MEKHKLIMQLQDIEAPIPPGLALNKALVHFQSCYKHWNPMTIQSRCLFGAFTNNTGQDIKICEFPDTHYSVVFQYDDSSATGFIRGFTTQATESVVPDGKSYFFMKPLSLHGIRFNLKSIIDTTMDYKFVLQDPNLAIRIAKAGSFAGRIKVLMANVQKTLIDFNHKTDIVEYHSALIELFRGNINTDSLQNILHYSDNHCRKKFKQQLGITPKYFSRIVRINKVQHDIMYTDYGKLTDLATSCGYYDHAHFIKECKKVVNLTPSEIKKISGK